MLGERIRKLRKQKKMTLELLAGKELTKGMLSLIENNKAKPSMESLAYIADQLGVEVSDLLEEVSTQELREVLEKAEMIYNGDYEQLKDHCNQLITLIEPYVKNLSLGYEAARLLDIYSRCLFYENQCEWYDLSDRATKMYDQMKLTSNRASIGIFRAMEKFREHDYSSSLEIFLNERKLIESTHVFIDPMTKIDLDYHEAILYFAIGDSISATRIMENAIIFSREKRIFYNIDQLYRLAAAHAMMSGGEQKKEYFLNKLKLYAEFTDDTELMLFYEMIDVMTLITEKHDYIKALERIDDFFTDPKKVESYGPWFLLEKGKALYYLYHYDEAINCLEKVEIPSQIHHPFDLSILYVLDSYKALSYLELGDKKAALTSAKKAVDNFESLPPTTFKSFCLEAYNKVIGE